MITIILAYLFYELQVNINMNNNTMNLTFVDIIFDKSIYHRHETKRE